MCPVLLVLMSRTTPDLPACVPPTTLHRAPSLSFLVRVVMFREGYHGPPTLPGVHVSNELAGPPLLLARTPRCSHARCSSSHSSGRSDDRRPLLTPARP